MKKKRKLRYGRLILVFILFALGFIGIYKMGHGISQRVLDKLYESHLITNLQKNKSTQINQKFNINEIYSRQAILINLNDNSILLEDGSEERIYPASLTKIMTAIIALENISNLQESILLPENVFKDLYAANASRAGFLPGEEVTAIDLLYGNLLPSGADASIGLATHVSGTEKDFVELMNDKAKKLGMKNTHFVNVTGLHDSNHYTTVKDISILLQYALKNENFWKIFTSSRHSTAPTNLHPGGITFSSTLFEKMNRSDLDGGNVLGGKTGYTEEAGLCLASLAVKNGNEYVLVTAGAAGNSNSEQYHIIDALNIFNNYLLK